MTPPNDADGAIGIGDYVEVAWPMPCCGKSIAIIGERFVVAYQIQGSGCCKLCGKRRSVTASYPVAGAGTINDQLRKLPPLATLESTSSKTDEPEGVSV